MRVKIDDEIARSNLSVLDTGAGPSLISKGGAIYLAADIKTDPGPSLRCHKANGKPLQCVGTTTLDLRLGTYKCLLTPLVVERLSTNLILGRDFINNHVESLNPRLREVMMKNGSIVRIRRRISTLLREEIRVRGHHNPPTPSVRKIRIAYTAVIPPSSAMIISVRCSHSGTFYIQLRSESHEKRRVLITNGVIDIQQDVLFTLILPNFSSVPQRLHKNQIVGYSVPIDEEGIFPLQDRDLNAPPKHKEGTILHPVKEDDQSLIDVDINHLPNSVARKVKQMLRKHSKMCSRNLGEPNASPHRINLEAGSRPVHAHLYRARSQARIIEQEEVRRESYMAVIGPCK